MSYWKCGISVSNERPPPYPGLALLHHRSARRHGFTRCPFAQSDPASRQSAAKSAGGKYRTAAFQPDTRRLYPDRGRRRPAAAGPQGGIGYVGFQDDGGFLEGIAAGVAARRHDPGSRIHPARPVRAKPRHLAEEDRGVPALGHERRRAGADRQGRSRRRILRRCNAPRIAFVPDLVRAPHRRRKISACAADDLRLPGARAYGMERQGAWARTGPT